MGVAPVDGYGPITKSNAAEIYKDKETYNNLSPAQKHLVDKYVPQEERDQIDYDTGADHSNAYQKGQDALGDDLKMAKEHGGQGGNAAATTTGNAIFAAGACVLTKIAMPTSTTSGWAAIGLAAATLACSIGTVVCSKLFDNAYDDRTKVNDNAEGTNGTIDETKNALEETMDLMNEDMDLYQGQQEEMTNMVNNNVSAKADLQAQLVDAQAAGDTNAVKQLKEQIKALDGVDLSAQQEEIDETREHLEEYQLCNDEAHGVADGGQTVSEFLQEGTPMGIVAAVNVLLLTIATGFAGACIASSMVGSANDASHFDFAGSAQGIAAAAIYAVAVGLLGTSTGIMTSKTKKEFECGSSGRDMEGSHVNPLYEMIDEQSQYVESTGENFDETDEGADESRSNAEESAAETVKNAKDRVAAGGGKKDDDDDDKDKDKDKK